MVKKIDTVYEKLSKIEASIRKVVSYPIKFVCRYTAISIIAGVILLGFGLSTCDGCTYVIDLSRNSVTKSEAETIVESINCAWSERHKTCFCVYANGGAIGGYAPDHVCGK